MKRSMIGLLGSGCILLFLAALVATCAEPSAEQSAEAGYTVDDAWEEAVVVDSRDGYEAFLENFPQSDYEAAARLRLAEKEGDPAVDESTGEALPPIDLEPLAEEALDEKAAEAEDQKAEPPKLRQGREEARARRPAAAGQGPGEDAGGMGFRPAVEQQVQQFRQLGQRVDRLIEAGAFEQAAALQEQSLAEFPLIYSLSAGARLRAEFKLLDLYRQAFAFNKADILMSSMREDSPADDLATFETLSDALAGPEAEQAIFLGLIEPDPEMLANSRGVQRVNTSNYTVRGYVHAYEGLDYLTINGDSVRVYPNAMFRHALRLEPGPNALHFEARSASGSLRRDTVVLDYREEGVAPTRPPRKWILAIAVQDYPETAGWPDLRTPQADARAFLDLAQARYGFQVFDTLFDARATRERVVASLKRLRFETRPEDELILYFAGHGRYDEEYTRQGYWIFHDREWSNSDQLAYLHRVPADDILIIADACFAGSFYYAGHPPEPPLRRERARWVLASGRLEPVQDVAGSQSAHSPFAAELLDFLRNSDTPFSAYELGRALVEPVFERSGERQRPIVRPFSGDTGGEWLFQPVGAN